MRLKMRMLFFFLIILIITGCDSRWDDIAISTIQVWAFEDLNESNQPVCLKLKISSFDRFDDDFLMIEDVSIEDNTITIDIYDIKRKGKCEYPGYLSTLPPDDYKCPASTDLIILDNLDRGFYNVSINLIDDTFDGELEINDQLATLFFHNNSININRMPLVPDSCIFGTYYSVNGDSSGYQDMLDKLLNVGCRQFEMSPGRYRAFEIDSSGYLHMNSGQSSKEPTFILKYDLNNEQIKSTLNDYVQNTDEVHAIIFKDYEGNYYNIKKNLP